MEWISDGAPLPWMMSAGPSPENEPPATIAIVIRGGGRQPFDEAGCCVHRRARSPGIEPLPADRIVEREPRQQTGELNVNGMSGASRIDSDLANYVEVGIGNAQPTGSKLDLAEIVGRESGRKFNRTRARDPPPYA